MTPEQAQADFENTQEKVLDGLDDDMQEKGSKSASTVLVELAQDRYIFGMSTTGETFAIPKSGPKVVLMLRGSKTSLRNQLAKVYFQKNRRTAPQQALADALLVIEGMAQEEDEVELYNRVAHHEGALWVDMGDSTGQAIQVTATGWRLAEPPVLFKRTALNGPLPEPALNGSLDGLWARLNVTKDDRPLVLAWLISCLYHEIPHPVMVFLGEQGTGKTSAQKILVSIIDPGPVPTRKPPRDPDSWVTAAAGSWIVGLDNLSDVPPWLSDSICRAVTGDGDVRRKLYTDGEHAVFAFRRAVILNGIDLGATRGDLGDRMLPLHLEVIPEGRRVGEHDIWPAWQKAHSGVLGAVLDLAVKVMAITPSVELATRPRMADFAHILAAVDHVLGTDGLIHYLNKQMALAADSLSGDPFTIALQERLSGEFTGTSADLLHRLTRDSEKLPKGWPSTARTATQRLNRHAPALRKAGWSVTNDGGRNHRNAVIWTLTSPIHPEIARNSNSQGSQARKNGEDRESASHASKEYGPSKDDRDRWGTSV